MPQFAPNLVLFDLDGTLVDSVPDLHEAVNRMLAELGRPTRSIEQVRDWIGNGIKPLVSRALTGQMDGKVDEALLDEAVAAFDRAYQASNGKLTRIFPGVIDGLKFARTLDIPVGLMTNTPRAYTEPLLAETGLLRFFDHVHCGDDLPVQKPDAGPLLYVAGWFRVEPTAALMVGDSISDLNAARAAGFNIVCTSYGYNHGRDIRDYDPDAMIDSLDELSSLLVASSAH